MTTIIPRYEIDGGKFDPEEIVDVAPEQAAANAKLAASEERVLRQVEANNERQFKKAQAAWEGLGTISTEVARIALKKREQHREDRQTQIAFDVMTRGIGPQLEAKFRDNKEHLWQSNLDIEKLAGKIETETGDLITAQEFRKMAGWEQYELVEAWVRQQAKGYDEYVYNAYETETVTVDRDGVPTIIGGNSPNQPRNPQEQAALDTKIKFNYARRFAGVSEGLLATVLKPELEKYDKKRFDQQSLQREKAYQIQKKESDTTFVENFFVTAEPQEGVDNAMRFAERFATREKTSIAVGRMAFADYLVQAVSTNKITGPEAMSIISHEFTARDGSTKTMISWKEWNDLPERLEKAAKAGTQAKEENREAKIALDLQRIRSREDWTNEEKDTFREIFKQRYDGRIPNKLQSALAGHEEDWAAKERLNMALRRQNDKLYSFQLDNVSNDVFNTYSGKVDAEGALVEGSKEYVSAQKYIKAFTNSGSNEYIGETDTASNRWLNLNAGLTEIFNSEYTQALYDENGIKINSNAAAFKIAKDATEKAAKDPTVTGPLMNGDFDFEGNEVVVRGYKRALEQAGGGMWRTNEIYATPADQEALLRWAKNDNPTNRGIPEHYIEVGKRINVAPYDLAQRQAALISEDGSTVKDRDVNEIENTPNRVRLLYHFPRRSRTIRSFIDFGYELNGEGPNVKTSIFNKNVFLTPGV